MSNIITPVQAREKRSVRSGDAYKKHVAEISALLCGPPNHHHRWRYVFPTYRDGGLLRKTVILDFQEAGWRIESEGAYLLFEDPCSEGAK